MLVMKCSRFLRFGSRPSVKLLKAVSGMCPSIRELDVAAIFFVFLTAGCADKHGYGEQKQTKETKIVGRWKETSFSSSWRQRSQSFTVSKSIVSVMDCE